MLYSGAKESFAAMLKTIAFPLTSSIVPERLERVLETFFHSLQPVELSLHQLEPVSTTIPDLYTHNTTISHSREDVKRGSRSSCRCFFAMFLSLAGEKRENFYFLCESTTTTVAVRDVFWRISWGEDDDDDDEFVCDDGMKITAALCVVHHSRNAAWEEWDNNCNIFLVCYEFSTSKHLSEENRLGGIFLQQRETIKILSEIRKSFSIFPCHSHEIPFSFFFFLLLSV